MKRVIIALILLSSVLHQAPGQYRAASSVQTKEARHSNPLELNSTGESTPEGSKSVVLAAVASLFVPGLGEWYVESIGSGKYHAIAEGGLWLVYAGFRTHATWLRQDAQSFAQQHAGANFDNKDDFYSVNIGNFNTTNEYNEEKLRNRETDLLYATTQYQWQWDSDANRLQFKDIRIRSDETKNNAKFVIAAIVINHVLSAFSAGRKAALYNRSLSTVDNIHIQTYAISTGSAIDGVGLSVTTNF